MEEAPRRRSRTWLWILLTAGALVLLTVIVAVAVVALAGRPAPGEAAASRITWDERYVMGEGPEKIAVLPVTGVIGLQAEGLFAQAGATPETLRSQLEQAARDTGVQAVILEVESPGGGVVASDEMHQAILDFRERTEKPVVVSMGSTAASGGYYISTAADRIVANPTTLTGSIGVIFRSVNYAEAADRLGIEEVVVQSGEFKNMASPFDELTPEEREILQSFIDEAYDRFVGVIVEGRDLPEERVRELADGRIYSGQQAEQLGLVDGLGNLEDAAATARELAGVDEATVVRYEQRPGFLDLLMARLAPPEPEILTILRAAGFDPTPELQYLYRPGAYAPGR
ncbi:signal peptide peptidase SppA [Rubrobacter taiwanensis]|jgi:protease-4|uniref:Signal peptide peptidase SppA n=1 Tax=Rubrobacter taiwanensis TaxID=185139 RepID=A0A4R1BQW7_9ACTN|nr:signal peptide peptidase SppA [Rubrobacter taiwanensis]TCJ19687.1 signal peptide peptidase SppA [Rubrobacter taiwanensis]